MLATRIAPREPDLWGHPNLVRAVEAAGITLWAWNVDTNALAMDGHACDLWGIPRNRDVRFEDLSAHIIPSDRDRVRHAFEATRSIIGSFEIDFRVVVDGALKWVSARGQGHDAGIVGETVFGIFLDVTDRKLAEEGREMIAGEMSHRVKNLLAIASGLSSITARCTATTEEMARELTLRFAALGRAHDLVRPQPGQPAVASATLDGLLSVLLAPYADVSAFTNRIRVSVPPIRVGQSATTVLAMVVHELATNSLKHGALSCVQGLLDISCTVRDGTVMIVWTESGSPTTGKPAGERGYGSRLVERSVNSQLRGAIHHEWVEGGVIITLCIPLERLAA